MSTDPVRDPSESHDQTEPAPTTSVPSPADAPPARPAVSATRERAELKRQEKLDLVQEQVESGSLVIRQMTDAEREQFGPRPAPPNRPRGR